VIPYGCSEGSTSGNTLRPWLKPVNKNFRVLHNHPSGNHDSSDDDIKKTKKIYACGDFWELTC
jgi:DNA repair protein RadC